MSNEENNNEFEQMLDDYTPSDFSQGGTIQASIVKISDDFVFLDINQKTERRMPIDEIKDAEGNLLFKVNDIIEVLVDNQKLSYKKAIEKKRVIEFIDQLSQSEESKIIKVKSISKTKAVMSSCMMIWNFLCQNHSQCSRKQKTMSAER